MNVIAKYIPKKKSIQIKGFKESYRGNRKRLKKSHAFSMTFSSFEKCGWLKGAVDLDEVNNLEQKKAPRPKYLNTVCFPIKEILASNPASVATPTMPSQLDV